jgi:DNA invertase Pin-like site-specific DNA recombinase
MASSGLKLDGYVRVSQVRGRGGDSFISPAMQRERITQWAAAFGHDLVIVHEEFDESGARADRPALLRAIERVEAGDVDGIVVAKLDRFARSLIDGLQMIERIQQAGGTFVSVADGLDLTTDTGRLVLRIMLSLAEFELDRVRGNWKDAQANAVMRGIHPSAVPPFGYRREGKGGPLLPDPVNGPRVRELFERRSAGAGPSELADWLNSTGAITAHGRDRWSHRAVKDILRNEVYLGVAFAGDARNPDAHEPLVNPEIFQQVQHRGVQFRPRTDGEPEPIQPLLRCAGCRYTMRARRRALADGTEVRDYTCRAASTRSAWECTAPARITDHGDLTDIIVGEFLGSVPRLRAFASHEQGRLPDLDDERARRQVAFDQWRDDARIQEQLGMDAYLAGLTARQDALNEAIAALAAEASRVGLFEIPADLVEKWPALSKRQQRDLLQSAIRCVFVQRSPHTTSLEQRLRLIWQGDDVNLPSRGDRGWSARPFDFADSETAA